MDASVTAKHLKSIFAEFDKDGTGKVGAPAMKAVLRQMNPTFGDGEVDSLLAGFGDAVAVDEFVDYLCEGRAPQRPVCGPRLQGKVAVVTGAGSSGPGWGVGKAIAVAMARQGAAVGLVDVNTAAAEETAVIIRSEGGRCAVLPPCDISKPDQVEAMVAACEGEFGPVTTLVNNVGLVCPGDVTNVELGKWELINSINLMGAYNCSKTCLTSFLQSGLRCSIVNIGSISCIRALRSEVAYAASKGGMNSLTVSMAREFAGRNIRCNCVLPGIIETPLVAAAYAGRDLEKIMASRHAQSPTGRMGDAWDIAHACVYFASDEASYANGVVMAVDGAFSQQVLSHADGMPPVRPPVEAPAVDYTKKLAGKVTIITGSEYARAIASTFAGHGAKVFVAAPDAERICAEVGEGCTAHMCDLTDEQAVDALVRRCAEAHGGVDVLINGHGEDFQRGMADTSPQEFADVYRRNATSFLLTMRFAIPRMLERGQGAILNITSIAGIRYVGPQCAVATAAGSVNTMTLQTAVEFAARGVRCNSLVPFVMDRSSASSLGFDVANAALHLCSEEARYTSGQIIPLDMSLAWRVNVNA